MSTRSKILDDLFREDLSEKQGDYLRYHRQRIEFLVQLVENECAQTAAETLRAIDIAPHFSTRVLREAIDKIVTMDSLGYLEAQLVGDATVDQHHEYDLNRMQHKADWPKIPQYDVVIFCEILEHLFVKPEHVFQFLGSVLTKGGFLVLQTPNGVAGKKRAKMLLGVNPFEFINDRRDGHVREFTAAELRYLANQAGLRVERLSFEDYWPERGLWRGIERFVPSMRRGLCLVARKP